MKSLLLFLILISFYIPQSFAQDSTSKGRISGYTFSEYFYNAQRDTFTNLKDVAFGGPQGLNGFQFNRIYFTYDYDISKTFSTRLRFEGGHDETFQNGKVGVFIKDAYIEWKDIFKGSTLTFGIQPIAAFTVTESIWNYRSVERTLLDLRGIVDSRDFGISLKGTIGKEGKTSYSVMLGNNSDVKVENDKYKRVYGHLAFNPVEHLFLTLFADYRAQPERNRVAEIGTSYSHDQFTYSAMLGYKKPDKFAMGVESYIDIVKNDILTETVVDDKHGFGISVFASAYFTKEISIFGRYDFFDNNIKEYSKVDSRSIYIFGLEYKAMSNIAVSPNIGIETYEPLANGTKIKPSITPRLSLFYNFF